MKIILIIIVLVTGSIVNAQYALQWYATYDNPHPSYKDFAVDMVKDNSGNVYVTGTSFQIDLTEDWRYDFATIKYNSNGDSVWVRRYDSSIGNESEDNALAIGIDGQNNVYVSGNSYNGNNNASIIKYDANGNQIWVRNYFDSSLTVEILLFDMQVDKSGNVFLLCSYNGISGISEIIKYNTNGDIEWVSKYYVGTYDINNLISLTLDNSGSVYATGCTRDSGSTNKDYLTVKYSANGLLQWTAKTNQTNEDIAYSIKTDDSGNVYVAGYSKTSNGYDMKLIKYDYAGNQEWIRSHTGKHDAFGFYNNYREKMILLDTNNNIYINFTTFTSAGNNDIATAKYKTTGELEWINVFNIGPSSTFDLCTDMEMDNSNNIYLTGVNHVEESNDPFVILKYDSAGVLQKIIRNENQFPDIFFPASIVLDDNGDITATGSCIVDWDFYVTDYFTVKYSKTIGINTISNSIPAIFSLHQNYPNPFNPTTNIKYEISKSGNVTLKIFNVLGKEIATPVNQKQNPGIYEVTFDGSNLSGGVYFYKLESNGFSETKKMIILK